MEQPNVEPADIPGVRLAEVPSASQLTSADAETLTLRAAQKRAWAAETPVPGDPLWRAQEHAEAAGLDALAARLRDPTERDVRGLRPALGGETVPLPNPEAPGRWKEVMHTARQSADLLGIDAGLERLDLARNAGVLTLALEAAESVGADDAVQKMLTHQMTGAHRLAMRLVSIADSNLYLHQKGRTMGLAPNALVECTRSAIAAARLMDSFSRSALALDRLRNGGRQTVTVQHVTVADGGQAVVAGCVGTGGDDAAGARPRGGQ